MNELISSSVVLSIFSAVPHNARSVNKSYYRKNKVSSNEATLFLLYFDFQHQELIFHILKFHRKQLNATL